MAEPVKIPRHIAVIMDGNGRWAKERGKERLYGHMAGVESVRRTVEACNQRGVQYLTLYVFSTENWGRPQQEVDGLMELLCESISKETESLARNGVKVIIIGDKQSMSEKVRSHIASIEEKTSHCQRLTLLLALNYGAREEIAGAVRKLADNVRDGQLDPSQITPELIGDNLATAGIPDPDLLIRTSGERRLSNYLLWQCAYTELYFTPALWPDFDEAELDKAIADYSARDRRYGLIKEQNSYSTK